MNYTLTFTPEIAKEIETFMQAIAETIRKTFTAETQQSVFFGGDSGSSSTHCVFFNNQGNWEKQYIEDVKKEVNAIQKLMQVKQVYLYSLQIDKDIHRWKFDTDINPEIGSDAIDLIAKQQFGIEPDNNYAKEKLIKAEKQESIKKTLAYACYQNDLEAVKQMLSQAKPAAIEKKIKLIGSPLHSAVIHNNIAMAEKLLAAGADLESANFMRFTPLLHAIDLGHEDMARRLIDLGADPSKRGAQNNNAFSLAVCRKNISRSFLELLLQKGCQVNETISDKRDLLSLAVGNPVGVQFLLDNGIDKANIHYAMQVACSASQFATLEILFNAGGSSDAFSVNHSDILYKTCQWNRLEMVKYLIEKGVSFTLKPEKPVKLYFNLPVKFKDTPYEWAKHCGLTEIAQLIEKTKDEQE